MVRTASATLIPQELRDQVVRALWTKGRACAPDLANTLSQPASADDVLAILKALADDGIVRKVSPETSDSRKYEEPYQTVFELA